MSDNWITRKRPPRLERRIEFSDYEETREFLERAAELSESQGYYPDMSFGRTHVSISIQPEDSSTEELSDELIRYAHLVDELVPAKCLSN